MVPSSGTLEYEEENQVIHQSDFFTHIAIATPYMELVDEFTLSEMVRFHFSFKAVRENRSIEELIELFGLEHAKDKAISNFSSGMRQRLKLGLAFYSNCRALFLDEPTTNLEENQLIGIQNTWNRFLNKHLFSSPPIRNTNIQRL
jgi:ABC-type multidrug transport system ATPase subunit